MKGIPYLIRLLGVAGVLGVLIVAPALAEPLSVQDRDEIVRLGSAQGRSARDLDPLLEQVNKVGEKGFPTESMVNKVKEGLAKGVEPQRIDQVLRQMTERLESAHEVLEEAKARGITEGNRQRALETMAEALARGATKEEVRELSRMSLEGKQKVTQDVLAAGAKGLAVMKEANVSTKDGAALLGEGIRQGYRANELLDLSREVKRRGSDFQQGRVSLQQLRERIGRGEKSDRLFRDDRSGSGSGDRRDRGDRDRSERDRSERDRAERDGRADHDDRGDRKLQQERYERIDRPDRSERADRFDRPERLERPDRPERFDRSGRGRD
ncbi:MAG: hypothetical protein NNA30_07450 [Nitrospira sp.]|nr:hypothetical protein [Nitrospira sp.]